MGDEETRWRGEYRQRLSDNDDGGLAAACCDSLADMDWLDGLDDDEDDDG